MPDVRCPKHDIVFSTVTDHRMPGSGKAANLAAHPRDGHTDCPKCQEEAAAPVNTPTAAPVAGTKRRIA